MIMRYRSTGILLPRTTRFAVLEKPIDYVVAKVDPAYATAVAQAPAPAGAVAAGAKVERQRVGESAPQR